MRPDANSYAKIVCGIYDAALDDTLWPQVAGRIADLVGRQQVCLESINYQTGDANLLAVVGYDVDHIVANLSSYVAHDPWAPHVPADTPGVLCGHELLSESDRRRSLFINELAPEAGMATYDLLATFLHYRRGRWGAEHFGGLIIYSDERQGHFTPEEVHRVGLLRPHLVQAARVRAQLASADVLTSVRDYALDNARTGMWVVGHNGRVLHRNLKAREHERAGHCRVIEQRLELHDSAASTRLAQAIANFAGAKKGPSLSLIQQHAFEFLGADGRTPLIVSVVPVSAQRSGALLPGHAERPSVLVSVADQTPDLTANVAVITGAYGLTEAEQRVLARFVTGESLREIAEGHRVSVHTVRTQIKSILAKTGARSQVDLANRVHNAV